MITGPLYPKIINCTKKNLVLQGGTSSAKTVTTLQALGTIATQQPKKLITITAQDLPTLKKGALRDFQSFVESDREIESHIQRYNKSDYTYTYKNKTQIEFTAFDTEQKAKGSRRDYLYGNECNGIPWKIFWQLQRRTRIRTIVDYNPNAPFWVHEKLLSGKDREFPRERVQLYITDHRHNPFLTQDEHDSIENISDPELHRVYARGLTGKITGLIFGHFKKCKQEDCPYIKRNSPEYFNAVKIMGQAAVDKITYDRIIWGIDYGYTNDETAVMKIWVQGRKRWCKEICYQTGLPAETLATLITSNGYEEGQQIYSEVDAGMINQLRILGLPASPAIKGPGCEIARIAKVREHECFYFDSPNFEAELLMYKWVMAVDMATGKDIMTNQPVKGWDHLCDAFAYADYTDSFRQ